ncbi:hypothetical protein OIU77_015131 [Salix suchowensis]|uniref:NADH dehydrogenase subunit 6 n=1 Tax=Salix suchowensis TaxID=1278906 RepID=A0ABQ8ZT31_9ROSI|nr:hypothetical protein OIU77_015131 [Salix suchowensis]
MLWFFLSILMFIWAVIFLFFFFCFVAFSFYFNRSVDFIVSFFIFLMFWFAVLSAIIFIVCQLINYRYRRLFGLRFFYFFSVASLPFLFISIDPMVDFIASFFIFSMFWFAVLYAIIFIVCQLINYRY